MAIPSILLSWEQEHTPVIQELGRWMQEVSEVQGSESKDTWHIPSMKGSGHWEPPLHLCSPFQEWPPISSQIWYAEALQNQKDLFPNNQRGQNKPLKNMNPNSILLIILVFWYVKRYMVLTGTLNTMTPEYWWELYYHILQGSPIIPACWLKEYQI